jgi:ABC-type multidrug transport system fused ATPase/permease subunit
MEKQTSREILGHIKPYWLYALGIFLLMILDSAGSLASPYFLKIIIDDIFPEKDYGKLILILSSLVVIYILRVVSSYFASYLYTIVSNGITFDIRAKLFDHLMRVPYNFFTHTDKSDIIHRINNEAGTVKQIITSSVIRFSYNLLTIIGLAIMLCILDPALFLISSIIIPLLIISIRLLNGRIQSITKSLRESESELLQFFSERFENIKLTLLNRLQPQESEALKNKMNAINKLELQSTKYVSLSGNTSTFLIALTPIIVFGWGGKGVLDGTLTVGTLVAFIQYMNRLYAPVKDLTYYYLELIRGAVSMERITEYLRIPASKPGKSGLISVKKGGALSFSDVGFEYDGRAILTNLNLHFEFGKRYALVGQSGSGKSTIIDLIGGLHAQHAGSLQIGTVQLNEQTRDDWRDRVSIVSQKEMLFNMSLKDNVLYLNKKATGPSFAKAVQIAGVDVLAARLDDGFGAKIGTQAVKFSRGEAQRIALARALVKPFDILILDEATSAIDSEGERKIMDQIKAHFPGKTMIIISHRLSAIRDVDEILVLKDGECIEQGTHAHLIESRGHYYNLFRDQIEENQTSKKELEAA